MQLRAAGCSWRGAASEDPPPGVQGQPQRHSKLLALAGRPGRRREEERRYSPVAAYVATGLTVSQTLGTYTHVLEQQKTKTATLIDSIYEDNDNEKKTKPRPIWLIFG